MAEKNEKEQITATTTQQKINRRMKKKTNSKIVDLNTTVSIIKG